MTDVLLIGLGLWLGVNLVVVLAGGRLARVRKAAAIRRAAEPAAPPAPAAPAPAVVAPRAVTPQPERRELRTDGYGPILLARLVVQACRVLAVDKACLLVRDPADPSRLIAVATHGLDADVIGRRVPREGPMDAALRTGAAQRTDSRQILEAFGRGTGVVAPLPPHSKGLGVLCAASTDPAPHFVEDRSSALRELAALCAGAVEDVTLKDRLEPAIRVCADGLAAIGGLHSRVVPHSVVDVPALAMQVSTRLGLEPGARIELELAAHVYDIGMDREDEDRFFRTDWTESAVRLSPVPGLEVVALIVRFLGECWDGSGRPYELRGEQIPLATRILAACNALRVITTEPPYGAGASVENALRIIQSASGSVFDPTVVAALSHELIGEVPDIGERVPAAEWARADAQYAAVA